MGILDAPSYPRAKTDVLAARPNTDMVVFGDSYAFGALLYVGTMGAYSATSGRINRNPANPIPWMLAQAGQRINITRYAGVGGNQISQMLARWDTDVAPYLTPGGWVTVLTAGTNDMLNGIAPATTIANLNTLFNLAEAAGVRVLTATIPPKSNPAATAAQLLHITTVNHWLRAQALRRRGLRLADWHAAASDGTATDDWIEWASTNPSHLTADGTHTAGRGAARFGLLLFRAIERDLPAFAPQPFGAADNATLGGATPNLVGGFTGTGGTVQNGITGTAPTGWVVKSGDGAAVAGASAVSIIPATDADSPFYATPEKAMISGPLLKISNTGAAASRVEAWFTIASAGTYAGRNVRASLGAYVKNADISGATAAGVFGMNVTALNGSAQSQIVSDLSMNGAGNDQWPTELGDLSLVLKTEKMLLPTGTSQVILKVMFYMRGTLYLYRPEVRLDPVI